MFLIEHLIGVSSPDYGFQQIQDESVMMANSLKIEPL